MKLGDNVDIIAPLNVKTADIKTGYLLLNPTMVNNGKIENFDNAEVPERYKNGKNKIADKYFVKKNDVLFQAKGSKIEVIYVDQDYENVLPATLYFILRANEKINPKYLQWLLKTELLLLYFEKKYKTMSAVRAVNKSDIVELDIDLPEREVQDKMVEIITSFENEEKNTIDYLKIKKKYIEEKVLEKNQVRINEK
ncbi:restriction endonuclease subunit S [Leptotrichia buccalis]